MRSVINAYKPTGYTPYQLIEALRDKKKKLENKKIAYAGRLDPMAKGVVVLLIEPETKRARKYQKLDKEYEFEVLFGVETDSYDVLGIVKKSLQETSVLEGKILENVVKSFEGKFKQTYPPYSSKAVEGKPLYWWARQGRLNEINIPGKTVEVYSMESVDLVSVEKRDLKERVNKVIALVEGDFRQSKIKKSWKKFFNESRVDTFQVAKIRVECSSGTYVRSLAYKIGKKLSVPSIAYSILRTKVGEYMVEDSKRFC